MPDTRTDAEGLLLPICKWIAKRDQLRIHVHITHPDGESDDITVDRLPMPAAAEAIPPVGG